VSAQNQNQTQPLTARGFPISIIPSLSGNVLGMVEDAPYFLLLCAPFIPAGAILFLLGKLRVLK
jgi:hypothetical protein